MIFSLSEESTGENMAHNYFSMIVFTVQYNAILSTAVMQSCV